VVSAGYERGRASRASSCPTIDDLAIIRTHSAPMTLDSGRRLGPYEILSAIGAGGMGEVYRARDTTLRRDVAIKILPAPQLRCGVRRRNEGDEATDDSRHRDGIRRRRHAVGPSARGCGSPLF
jgi:serine/threonine protein kinase